MRARDPRRRYAILQHRKPVLLRDLFRNQIFERFLLFFGLAFGVAAALLVAWAIAVWAGPAAIPATALAACGLAAGAFGAWGVPRLAAAARTSDAARRVERPLFAIGFVAIALAATVAGATAAFTALAALLAMTGASAETGLLLFRAGTVVATACMGTALAWGFLVEGRLVTVTQQRVELASLPPELRGLRIAHLSDIHIGNGTEQRLDAIVARVNALGADLVAITGDLFDNGQDVLASGARSLAALRARLGVFAVLGNHDGFVGADRVAAALAEHAPDIELLRGRWAVVRAPAPLAIAGVDDPGHDWCSDPDALAGLEKLAAARPLEGPALLLVHRPDPFPQAAALGFALVLAGHYHGGQVALPLAGGRFNTARLLTRFDKGLHRIGDAALYVSRGLGFAGPRLRIGSRPEIAVIELA
jgi:predicted MPP superfamily phosphohydrolase